MKRLVFTLLSAALAALFVAALWQDANRGWGTYQRQFFSSLDQDERRLAGGGIKQFIIDDLDRVDRCTTCHLAMERPQLALAEQPFTAHPGKYLQWHPVEKFGCTVCHGGQGLATEVDAAHGDVPHWNEPLLRGPLVQASCRQCHGDLGPVAEHAPQLAQGVQLFNAKGCYGCHAVTTFGKEFGQTVSVDLTEVGSKPHELMTADFEMMPPPHNRIHWLARKLSHPRTLNPGTRTDDLPPGEEEIFPTAMPHFGLSEEEVTALSTYLLSLTSADLPSSYVRQPLPQPEPVYATAVERGKAVFDKFGCAACHGPGGLGGRHNWNAGLGGEVPSLAYVKAYYGNDLDALKSVIRNGRQPAPRADVTRPNPPLYMPAWKDRIPDQDIDALVQYLLSLAQHLPQTPPATEPGTPSSARGGNQSAAAWR